MKGVATYALELFTVHSHLDVVYVPIGMGSGICGLIAVRDLLGLKTRLWALLPIKLGPLPCHSLRGIWCQAIGVDIRRRHGVS